MTSAKGDPGRLKEVLRAAEVLLRPPGELPSEQGELRGRLEASWRVLGCGWDEGLAQVARALTGAEETGKREGDEVEDLTVELQGSSTGDEMDGSKTGLLVQLRSLDLLVGLQQILVKEFWPAELRGADARDFILGTADLRLIRLLLSHSLTLLSSLSGRYITSLRSSPPLTTPPLKPVLLSLLSLLRPTPPPPSLPAGPSAQRNLPPTTIAQLLLGSHIPPILLSCVLLGYTPSLPPTVHADNRRLFLSTLSSLPPAQALLALSGVRHLTSGQKSPPPPAGTSASLSPLLPSPPPYPAYVTPIINKQLSAQLLRPHGPRGLLLNMFGERALSDAEAVDERKVEHATEVLRRIPGGVEEGVYVRHVVRECLGLLGVPREGIKGAPRAFRSVAGGVVGRWVDKKEMGEVLNEAFEVIRLGQDEGDERGKGGEEERSRALSLLDTLIGYTDPAHLPRLLDIIIPPLLPSLRQLATAAPSSSSIADPAPGPSAREPEPATSSELAQEVLDTWERVNAPRIS